MVAGRCAMKRAFRWLGLLLGLALVFGAGWAWPILFRPPLIVGQDAITDQATIGVTPVIEDAGGRLIRVAPPAGTAAKDVLVIIYPGGLVRPQAYEWLARMLAVRGYETLIPEFSFDLAVTDTDRASALIQRYADGRKVVLAGHSLGGAMAAQYLADELKAGREPVAGLVLMAAYPPDGASLASAKLKVASLKGEFDNVADAAKIADGLRRLPKDSKLLQIDGGVHSFFGRYGPQSGDGVPAVSRTDAEREIVNAIVSFLGRL